ncbi:MAG: ATP-dependent helicase [Verrucomicrobiota bacterium]
MSFDYTLKPSGSDSSSLHIDYASELNESQHAAVTAKPGPLLVIAGAGSGKTRTLTYRVAYLIEHGVRPHQILLLTFTNKASKEMLRRVEDLIPQDIKGLWGGTFHHVGHRLLRRHAEHVGLNAGFSILDQEDAKDLVDACLVEAGIDTKDKRFPKGDVLLSIFSMSVNTDKSIHSVIEQQYPYFSEMEDQIKNLLASYQSRKLAANVVDYDDLLTKTLKLLQEQDDIREKYQKQFQHILVDEYQDTNKIQASLVDLLSAKHHQVMVVGDDAQSIYSWRGANFQNIMSFPDRHPETRVIKIETNYRSSPEILELANSSIANNMHQFPKELRSCRESSAKPALIQLNSSREQAMFIAQRILELHEGGQDLSEMVVLYRSHYHSMEIQMELTRRNIPFQITSGLRFFEQAHIKDVSAYIKFSVNRRDEVSFKRIARTIPGVGQASAQKMWAAISNQTPWDEVKVPAKAQVFWKQWGETHCQMCERLEEASPGDLIELVIDAVYDDYLKSKYTNYESRLEDLLQLRSFADEYDDMLEFLGQLALMTNVDSGSQAAQQDDDHIVRLTTIHQAKGLEWDTVFLVMLCEGMFPSKRSMDNEEGEEEERRLFYVAITRARNELYLVYPEVVTQGRFDEAWQRPSRFLGEVPEDLCNKWNISTESSWDNY